MRTFLGKSNHVVLFYILNWEIILISGKPSESHQAPGCNVNGRLESANVISGAEISRLAGGKEIKPHSYPWLVWIESTTNAIIKCGGIIISSKAVATAAGCVQGQMPENMHVTAGEHDKDTIDNSEQLVNVTHIKIVRKRPGASEVELAVMEVTPSFQLNNNVRIASLPEKNHKITGPLVAVGWGDKSFGVPSPVPHSLKFVYIPETECDNVDYQPDPRLLNGEFCANGGTNGTAACWMDLGGPAHEKNVVVGLLNTPRTTCGSGRKRFDAFVSMSLFAKEIEDFAGIPPHLKCIEDDVLFGVATNLMADICEQTKKFEKTKEIQPPLKYDLNNTIQCAHVTWTKSGHGCFHELCPNYDD